MSIDFDKNFDWSVFDPNSYVISVRNENGNSLIGAEKLDRDANLRVLSSLVYRTKEYDPVFIKETIRDWQRLNSDSPLNKVANTILNSTLNRTSPLEKRLGRAKSEELGKRPAELDLVSVPIKENIALVEGGKLDVNGRDSESGKSLLQLAMEKNDLVAVKKLVELGADITVKDEYDYMPLLLKALKSDDHSLFYTLIERWSGVPAKEILPEGGSGKSLGHREIVEKIIQYSRSNSSTIDLLKEFLLRMGVCHGLTQLSSYHFLLNQEKEFAEMLEKVSGYELKGLGELSEKPFSELEKKDQEMFHFINEVLALFAGDRELGFTQIDFINNLKSLSSHEGMNQLHSSFSIGSSFEYDEERGSYSTLEQLLLDLIARDGGKTRDLLLFTGDHTGDHAVRVGFKGNKISFYDSNFPVKLPPLDCSPENREMSIKVLVDLITISLGARKNPLALGVNVVSLESLEETEKGKEELLKKHTHTGPDSLSHIPLFIAARIGDLDAVNTLIQLGAKCSKSIPQLDLPMFADLYKEEKGILGEWRGDRSLDPLGQAILDGHSDVVEALIKAAPPPQDRLDLWLNLAGMRGDVDLIKTLMKAGVKGDLNQLLLTAVKGSHLDAIQPLIELGARIDPKNSLKFLGCIRDSSLVETLIEAGASDHLAHPLLLSSNQGNINVVTALLEEGSYLNQIDLLSDSLFAAVQGGHLDVVKLLIGAGANLEGLNYLSEAVRNGRLDVVEFLAELGIEKDSLGPSPSFEAVLKGNLPVLKALLKADGVLVFQDYLIYAVRSGRLDVLRALIEEGSLAEITREGLDRTRQLLLSISVSMGYTHIVEYLLTKPVEEKNLPSLLRLSALAGEGESIKAIIEKYPDLDRSEALIIASLKGHEGVVCELIDSGAKIQLDNFAINPLIAAASNGHLGVVAALISEAEKSGVDVAPSILKGGIRFARQRGHLNVINYLENHLRVIGLDKLLERSIRSADLLAFRGLISSGLRDSINMPEALLIAVEKKNDSTEKEEILKPLIIKELIRRAKDDELSEALGYPVLMESKRDLLDVLLAFYSESEVFKRNPEILEVPLELAVEEGDLEVVEKLLNHGAKISKRLLEVAEQRDGEGGRGKVVFERLKQFLSKSL